MTSEGKIGLCLDSGHCAYAGGDPVAGAEKYRSLLRFVHIKDVDNKILANVLRQKMNFEQAVEAKVFTIIGKGSVDFPAFFRVLAQNNYSGWLVVEQDVKFGATAVPPAQSIAASLKYLKTVVSTLEPAEVVS